MKKSAKLRQNKFLRPLFYVRDYIMDVTGLFKLKAKIKQKFFYQKLLREDAQKKIEIEKKIYQLPNCFIDSVNITNDDIIISLTSYGKRVEDTLPYALYSLLTQTIIPKKIAVFLDNENWSYEKLPTLLKKLQIIGIDFYYCKDIRSYKKLIPALQKFPNNPIVTMDDDFYYNPKYMEWITSAFENSDKKTVLGQWGCVPEKKDGKYIPYNQWKDCKHRNQDSEISFFGCGGCLYPPKIFDDEIFNEEVFMKHCPTADDIWFWVMEKRLNIKTQLIEPSGYGYNQSVNRIEEYDWSQKGTLMHTNVVGGRNDEQLRALLELYKID